MIATLLSNGESTVAVTEDKNDEYCVSQVFIAIEVDRLIDGKSKDEKLNRIMDYVKTAERSDPTQAVRLPGQNLPLFFRITKLMVFQWMNEFGQN